VSDFEHVIAVITAARAQARRGRWADGKRASKPLYGTGLTLILRVTMRRKHKAYIDRARFLYDHRIARAQRKGAIKGPQEPRRDTTR
jgi:hypothetical protein